MSPYSSITVGTDFSACSAVAVAQAVRLAGLSGTRPRVVHVLDTLVVTDLERKLSPLQVSIQESLVRDARLAWKEFASTIPDTPDAAGLELDIRINNRVVGLIDHARSTNADLLVVGALGDQAPDVGAGTVATGCVRKAPCDVLLVRDTHRGPYRTILACVDFSDSALRALGAAARFARREGAALHIINVYEGTANPFPFSTSLQRAIDDSNAQTAALVRERLDRFIARAGPDFPGTTPTLHTVDAASCGRGIVQCAKALGSDLIVLGTRGRSNLRDTLLGSTAERVLRDSRSSILAVRPAEFARAES
ncbi:MAG: universal stress protein [Phycisphaeraceae bacterium]|nr:universal stress protein [Phycisphaerae bacterium]MBX3393354.1 universal stress protein [Phycisphaeraceae bacterium]